MEKIIGLAPGNTLLVMTKFAGKSIREATSYATMEVITAEV